MAEFVFYYAEQPLDRSGVDWMFSKIADQVKMPLYQQAILELPLDYAKFDVSVDGGKPQGIFHLEGTDETGQAYVSMLKPPHGLPYKFPVAKIENGRMLMSDQLNAFALQELRYVVILWLKALHEHEGDNSFEHEEDNSFEHKKVEEPYLGIELDPELRGIARGGGEPAMLSDIEFKMFVVAFRCRDNSPTVDDFLRSVYPDPEKRPTTSGAVSTNANRMNTKLSKLKIKFDATTRTITEL